MGKALPNKFPAGAKGAVSYILYGVRSGEKYLPALIAALKLDPRKVEKATAA